MFRQWPSHPPAPWAPIWSAVRGFTEGEVRPRMLLARDFYCVHFVAWGTVYFAAADRLERTIFARTHG